ncbi:MAG: hypothetical protein KGO49_14115 [Gammaproteobacteria bacterium]|nr:hypothetical protein [Gammaproteobacteria bacterium]
MSTLMKAQSVPLQLPEKGFGRAKDILPFLPFSKTELWRQVKNGKFVKPIKLSAGITCWDYALVHNWLTSHSTSNQNNDDVNQRHSVVVNEKVCEGGK